MDAGVLTQLLVGQLLHHERALASIEMANLNLAQGLGVIHNSLIHAAAAETDDPALIAALQLAAGAPRQGSLVGRQSNAAAPAAGGTT